MGDVVGMVFNVRLFWRRRPYPLPRERVMAKAVSCQRRALACFQYDKSLARAHVAYQSGEYIIVQFSAVLVRVVPPEHLPQVCYSVCVKSRNTLV